MYMNSKLTTRTALDLVGVTTYNEEAESFAVQHRVNKLKQHHRRAFDLISKALKIDEEVGNKDGATVDLYKKGKQLLNRNKTHHKSRLKFIQLFSRILRNSFWKVLSVQ